MNWAWRQQLSPTPKLILMALADAANDDGVCWPSVSTVAAKCCVSVRTVRRVMQKLVDRGLLLSEQRYRKDGSCSSNRYQLRLQGGDRLSPAPDRGDTNPGQGGEGSRDTSDIPGTTIETQKETPQAPETAAGSVVTRSTGSGAGELSELEYPKTLSVAEQEAARQKLAGLPDDLAQQLLDELAASIRANVIQTTPLAYLRGLITRARAGTYKPEGALRIADMRVRRARVDAAIKHSETSGCDYPPAAVDVDDPLIKRLREIQDKLQQKHREPD